MTKHGGIETGDLVMNNHKGHIRYGTIIDKRIDEEGYEIEGELLEDPRSLVFHQAENRLHSQKAVLLHIAGLL